MTAGAGGDRGDAAAGAPPERDEARPIIETVVTTSNPDGSVNCGAMGVEWGEETIVIRPFGGTRTLRNLRRAPAAVVNLVDDILIFVRAALEDPRPPTVPAERIDGAVLADARSWREVEVAELEEHEPRARVVTRVVGGGTRGEFLGLNRARNAVLEASILATRTHLLPHDAVRAELERLGIVVSKTAGALEREAMELVLAHARRRLGER